VCVCVSVYDSLSLTWSRPWTIFITSFFHVKLNCYLKICTCPLTAHICHIFMYNYDICYCCQLCCLKLFISVRNPSSRLMLLQYTFHLPFFPHNLISETSGIMVTFNFLHGLTSSCFFHRNFAVHFLSSYLNLMPDCANVWAITCSYNVRCPMFEP
jgi:hypothetical protein